MVLIADERSLAKIMRNELLLLAYDVVFAFAAPSPLPLWAKRAFKEKLLSKLLASAIGCGDISLERAESEGKKLIQQGKEAKAVLAAKEKALTKAVAKLQSAGVDFSSVETQGKQSISDFLRLPCKVPFLGLPCISKTGVTESNLLMPPPPVPTSSTSASASSSPCVATATSFCSRRGSSLCRDGGCKMDMFCCTAV
jgi:hypothetical protein